MKHLFFLLTLLLCLPLAAQQTYHAQVVDAETGEALPYVNIYVASERGTMTNAEGHFMIQAEPTEQLTFRYVGYETVQVAASGLPSVIKMKPYAKELGQVVVQGNPTWFAAYTRQTLPEVPTDYRRTLYWNPNLKLDAEGCARVTLYNNSRTTQIQVEAAGQAADGTLLWNR